jgi:hypothetical protein
MTAMRPDTIKGPAAPGGRSSGLAAVLSPEATASILVGVLAVALLSSQVISGFATGPTGSPSPRPTASGSPGPTTAPASGSALSPLLLSALGTVVVVDDQVVSLTESLRHAIAAKNPVAEDIATILRTLNTEAAVGEQAANQLQAVSETATLGDDLVTFYESVTARNTATLGTSVRNVSGYVDGGTKVIKILADVKSLDTRVRAVLLGAGVVPSPADGAASPAPSTVASSG